jgi:hypothetical protein
VRQTSGKAAGVEDRAVCFRVDFCERILEEKPVLVKNKKLNNGAV